MPTIDEFFKKSYLNAETAYDLTVSSKPYVYEENKTAKLIDKIFQYIIKQIHDNALKGKFRYDLLIGIWEDKSHKQHPTVRKFLRMCDSKNLNIIIEKLKQLNYNVYDFYPHDMNIDISIKWENIETSPETTPNYDHQF